MADYDKRPGAPKAGATLDLSTGRAAPPPPEPPAPPAPRVPDPAVRAGKTLDLSAGHPSQTRRKPAVASLGHGPVVRETLDLSTKAVTPPEPAAPPPKARSNKKSGGAGRKQDRGTAPTSASSSLADLLDPEVLAKLRGEG